MAAPAIGLTLSQRLEMLLTALAIPLLAIGRDLTGLLRIAEAAPSPRFQAAPPEKIAEQVFAVSRRPILMRNRQCLRQGLLGYRFLRLAGYSPELRFGIDPRSIATPRIDAHCWVVLDGKPIIGDILPGMIEIHAHAPTKAP